MTLPTIDNSNYLSKIKRKDIFRKNAIKKRKTKNSLSQQVSKLKKTKYFYSTDNKNAFFNCPQKPSIESQLTLKFASLIPQYNIGDVIENLYQQTMQNNKLNERAYRHFYNRLSAKIEILKIIDLDQGKNIDLAANMLTKILSLFTYATELTSSAILIGLGAGSKHGMKHISDKRKVKKAKNKLNHCITDVNFIKLISILLTKMHELDFSQQENLELFIDKQFLNFWSLFKKQAKLYSDTDDLNTFWSTYLAFYLKELKCPLLIENFANFLNKITEISCAQLYLAILTQLRLITNATESKELPRLCP